MGKYMWSIDSERYYGGPYSTEQEAIEDAISENGLEEGETIYISEMERLMPPNFSDRFDAVTIAEWLDDYLCDNNSPYEDAHFDWTDEDKRELELVLDTAFKTWLKQKPSRFIEYYTAVAPKKVTVEVRAEKSQ